MEWKPIESAPKDGSWIACWDGEKVHPVCWVDDPMHHDEPYTGWAYADETWGGVLWEGYNQVEDQPSHWMPLPSPPKTDGEL